jgi:hypothetical protein
MTITRSLRSLAVAVLAAALVLPAAASAHGRPGGTGKHDSVHHASVQGRHGHRRHDAHGGHRRHDAHGGHRRHDAPHAAATPEGAASTTPVTVATPEAEAETEAAATTPVAVATPEAAATTTPTP